MCIAKRDAIECETDEIGEEEEGEEPAKAVVAGGLALTTSLPVDTRNLRCFVDVRGMFS
jgi:hypothetical protein